MAEEAGSRGGQVSGLHALFLHAHGVGVWECTRLRHSREALGPSPVTAATDSSHPLDSNARPSLGLQSSRINAPRDTDH
jgi:hypothetical protein